MDGRVNVLMVGSNTQVKGGMTTVVQSFLDHRFSPKVNLKYIATHSEKGKVYNSYFFAKSLVRIVYHLMLKKPDIMHLHMSDKGSFVRKYIVFKASKIFRKKVILHMHGGNFNEFYEKSPFQLQLCMKEMLRKSDKVIALGSNWKTILMEIEPDSNVDILMNSVAMPDFKSAKKAGSPFTILFLAVMNEGKGILDLIKASVPVISRAVDQGKRLVFEIAGDGPQLEDAKKLTMEYGIERFFQFHGWIGEEKKRVLLQKTDLFVLPSYFEGLPMSILEAISYGIPVLSTDVGSIDEAVKDGKNGYLITPGDLPMLESRLEQLIYHPSYSHMRQTSRNLAIEKFDEKRYFEQIEDLYLGNFQANDLQSDWESP
ncbi:glycosyltransferase family 4 protein [Planococcus sp. APC 3906]|uniref:glycosyltransferase family 4 protein n=1 Tax=Planococcus sp. APC 3906 TaxID=3035194 RepID=UPI0025B411A2|nr:glycosyltransferase family 4 protein [Planococcus sp. APC 3906]MDN3450101.1 glycosyltransferase family 4 protein [Planococcus sp. APC 3906]